jgi:hypothetical protein
VAELERPRLGELDPGTRAVVVEDARGVAVGRRKPAKEVAGGDRLHPVEPRGRPVELPGANGGSPLERLDDLADLVDVEHVPGPGLLVVDPHVGHAA